MRIQRNLEEAFAYYTECALATVSGLPKRTGKHDRERHEAIASGMVEHARLFLKLEDCRYRAPRLYERLVAMQKSSEGGGAGG